MKWFPQIGSGSIAQFPVTSTRQWRMIRNQLESGEQILLPDSPFGQIHWALSYTQLSDDETGRLADLFSASSGSFGQFGFVDPLANLLGWSGDLARPDWQPGLMNVASGVADPFGDTRGWTLSNGSPGDQELIQTVSIPGEYTTCFSVWLRSSAGGSVVLQRDSAQIRVVTTILWKRVYLSASGAQGATSSDFSVLLSPGQSVQFFGPQVEAQPYPSQFKQTMAAVGIYEQTWFPSDSFSVTRTAPGISSCDLKLISRI